MIAHMTPEHFVQWMDRVAAMPWPLTLEEFTQHTPQLGWLVDGEPYGFVGDFAGEVRHVTVVDTPEGHVVEILIPLCVPPVNVPTNERLDILNPLSEDYDAAAEEAWGPLLNRKAGERLELEWAHPSGGQVDLLFSEVGLAARYMTPQAVQLLS
ncbi:MAG: DUF6301 family protein [Actinomycetaceae bacterium]|nr:DUF6301 family protein [Actinomycetaceae bacterium]